MARGTIEDFNEKYGFRDAEMLEERDFRARDKLVELLNDTQFFKDGQVRALAYDVNGSLHNACFIIFVNNPDSKSDDDLSSQYNREHNDLGIEFLDDFEEDDMGIGDWIAHAYDAVDQEAIDEAVTKALVDRHFLI